MSIYHKDVAFDSLRLQDNKVVCYIFRKLLYCKNQMDISFELHTNADSRYNDVSFIAQTSFPYLIRLKFLKLGYSPSFIFKPSTCIN